MRKIFIPLTIILLTSCSHKKSIEITSTTATESWQKSIQFIKFRPAGSAKADIVIDTKKTLQAVTGFGGCFNELGWEALQHVPAKQRQDIMLALFDTVDGCRFNLCRMPIGANDYSVDWYSYDETPGDYNMKNFSVERDEQRLIPYIKYALAINPGMRVWASPWCPPSWMKTNHHYACASSKDFNDLPEDKQGKELQTQFRMEDKVLKAYALYFSKFINAYAAHGIRISSIHPQNELNSCQVFPSCIWKPADMATFIGKYLGPRFQADTIQSTIFMGTVERPQIGRIDTILSDKDASRYIKGVGFQWAGKDAIAEVHRKYPELALMQTETECGDGSNDWKAAEHTWDLMQHYFRNGAGAYMYWNMVLDETGKSQWGWKQNSMISINTKTGEVAWHPEFYLMKHLSAFVDPGDRYVETSANDCMVFTGNGKTVIVLHNAGEARDFRIRVDATDYLVPIPAASFNTLVI
jgi:glucosylceramidase